jgi:hypothetical protein
MVVIGNVLYHGGKKFVGKANGVLCHQFDLLATLCDVTQLELLCIISPKMAKESTVVSVMCRYRWHFCHHGKKFESLYTLAKFVVKTNGGFVLQVSPFYLPWPSWVLLLYRRYRNETTWF